MLLYGQAPTQLYTSTRYKYVEFLFSTFATKNQCLVALSIDTVAMRSAKRPIHLYPNMALLSCWYFRCQFSTCREANNSCLHYSCTPFYGWNGRAGNRVQAPVWSIWLCSANNFMCLCTLESSLDFIFVVNFIEDETGNGEYDYDVLILAYHVIGNL